MSRHERTCSCGCTRSASRATCSEAFAATAVCSSRRRCEGSTRKARARSSTSGGTKGGVAESALNDVTGAILALSLVGFVIQGEGSVTGPLEEFLVDLGISRMRLLTNNPVKRAGLEGYGLDIVERVPLESDPNPENIRYLETKREKLGHILDHLSAAEGRDPADESEEA